MKSWFHIKSPGRAHAWLLSFAVTRSVLDYFWILIHARFLYRTIAMFTNIVYLYTLYLMIPAMAGFMLGKVFSRPVNDRAVLRESVLVWVVYPTVTIVSLVTKSPPTRSIEWFRHIPTFMVDNNFFPTGMVAVVLVLVVFYTWLMMRHSRADWLRALASVLVSLFVIYLLYYQYTLRLFHYVYWLFGGVFGLGFLTLTYLIPIFPIAERFHLTFGSQRVSLHRLVLVSTIISIGLMGVGLIL